MNHTSFVVGDGSRIKFWHDSWCGELPLRVQFPELFRLARVLEAIVADHICYIGSNCHWDITICRPVHDWELSWSFSTLVLFDEAIWIRYAGGPLVERYFRFAFITLF